MKHTAHIEGNSYRMAGKTYTGTDAVGKMCRELETGTLEIYRGEKLCLVIDVEKRKTKALTENDKRIGYVKWQPFPEGVF